MNIVNAIVEFFNTDNTDNKVKETTTCNNCGAMVTFDPLKKAEVICSECGMPMFKTPKE